MAHGSASRVAVALFVFCLAALLISTASQVDAIKRFETELSTALKAANAAKRNKISITRLKRALDNARKVGPGVSDALMNEATAAMEEATAAEQVLQETRDQIQEALRVGDVEEIRKGVARAKELGFTKGMEITQAERALREYDKSQKKADRHASRIRRLMQDVDTLSSAEVLNTTALSDALVLAKNHLKSEVYGSASNQSYLPLLEEAQTRLDTAEWNALPLSVRLDRTSSSFGREHCRQHQATPSFATCQVLSPEKFVKRSRHVGEANCNHPTLRPGGDDTPLPNALPPETSKNFCMYPPPFDLQEADDGKGFRPVEFEFPRELFGSALLKDETIRDLAVLNIDMDLFRSNIAPCGGADIWLLVFYVHWCPHCMAMMPKLYKLGVALRAAGVPLRIGAVNCATEKQLCGTYQVAGHPLIALFYGGVGSTGQVQLFEHGGRDVRVNALLNHLKQNRHPAWDAGAPKDYTPPKHLFPAEATFDIVRLLPVEYRPTDAVMNWLVNSTLTTATMCPGVRTWKPSEGNTQEHSEDFLGNGWPTFEHAATPLHRLQDAALAIVYTLEEWVVPNPAGSSPTAFAFAELTDLLAWITLLADAFPRSFALDLHDQLVELRAKLSEQVQSVERADGHAALCIDDWLLFVKPLRKTLDAALEQKTVASLCRTETCRLWTLLHTLSVANLARIRSNSSSLPSNSVSFDAMFGFLGRYFTCTTCRKHLLEQVEGHSFRLQQARNGSALDLAIWWWHLHSTVSGNVAREGNCRGDRHWPPEDICNACWNSGSSTADETLVAQELVRQYWPEDNVKVVSDTVELVKVA